MKKCINCGERFETRFSTLEKYCWNSDCKSMEAMERLKAFKKRQNNEWKKRKSEIKNQLKTKKDWLKDLQKEFNSWVRNRDAGKQCISCDKLLRKGMKFDAGHFFPVGGYPNLRFTPANVHGQCVECNQHKHGNLHEYRKKLIERIGSNELERLERQKNDSMKLTLDEIKDLLSIYKRLNKEFKKNE